MSRRLRATLAGATLLLLGTLLFVRREHRLARAESGSRPAGPAGAAQISARPASPAADPTPADLRHLADPLGRPQGTAQADVELLSYLLGIYRSTLHGSNPVGDNAEITTALAGRNRLGYVFVPPGHPAINAAGELCDRWGTPYFFHQISGTVMQVRSAGPDRRMYTKDDLVAGP